VKRVNYCMWLLTSICAGLLDPFQYIMSDEAWFHLSVHVHSQNTRYWAAENPHLVHEEPLQDQKIGVWCAMSGTRIIGPIFLNRTVNTEVYMNIFEEFCAQLTEEERKSFFFQQDGATCHTSRVSLRRVHDVFSEERTVSKTLWPPRSPDLTTCDYFLWGHLESTAYESNPHTIQELKDNTSHAVAAIKITMLHRVYLNMIRHAQLCIDAGGNHFQHLLWWYILSAFGYCINFCIYSMLRTQATFS